ncbi:hypothetical protein [Arthrobacter sp. NamB2]|uniref:hypothetical protein n=1 Tax=Arthrobacter sp. NamB2 TaxID=2576035 RepID=UPI0010C9A3F8|nr:hypothetical protein [Arthrobacter sp. NamB2]
MILGDIKGEHIDMIEKLGGKGLPLGRGIGHINPLDDAGALEAATRLSPVNCSPSFTHDVADSSRP